MPADVNGADEEDVMLNSIALTALETSELDGQKEGNQAVLYALQLSPGLPREEDARQQEFHQEVRTFLMQRQPRAVVLGCGAGGALLAVESFFETITAVHPDWKSFVRVPAIEQLGRLQQTGISTAI